MFAPFLRRRMFCISAFVLACTTFASAQVNFTGPQPGDVYREYTVVPNPNGNSWRVTDPNTDISKYPSVASDLPNYTNHIQIGDLSGATRAEMVLTVWGGHVGTTNKAIRFNGNNWITIPELGQNNGIPAGHSGQCYMTQENMTIPVPLGNLVSGDNSYTAITGTQSCYGWGWGMFGLYNVMIRVYFDPASKSHPTGFISSPSAGGSFGENPTITTTITGGNVDRVDILGSYYGYDTDGDGVLNGYHYDYHLPDQSYTQMDIHNHVGTATGSPWQVSWNTQWVPDQASGGVKFLARIHDGSTGMWYCSAEVSNLSFVRNGTSVQMFQTTPGERCWAQGDVGPQNLSVTVPTTSGITAAAYAIRSYNMKDVDMEPGDYDWKRFNGNDLGTFGNRYYYSYDVRSLPVGEVVAGTNTFSIFSSVTVHHGIEILWPGPALLVRYNGVPSNTPPQITQQPGNQQVAEGQTATFSVSATGTGTLTYQWQKNQSDIGGAINPSYTTPTLTPADSGSKYRCIVTNSYGNATSDEAVLSVTQFIAPKITVQPLAQTVQDGQPASFSVTATGTSPLTYQWQKNAANIGGANSATFSIPAAASADSGALIRCVVSNTKGADTSTAVKLIVTPVLPAFTKQPANLQVGVGDSATFIVSVTGTVPRYYEWQRDGSPIPGANADTYTVIAAKADSGAAFRCKVTNSAGSVTSNPGYLIVGTFPPAITAHPVQAFVRLGQTATFSVTATGSKTLKYQWQRDSVDINGAIASSYTTPPVVLDDNGRSYRCVVSNDYGTAVSEAAVLSVTSDVNNLVANGGFETGTAPWTFYTNGSGSYANDSTGPASLHAAHVAITTAGDNIQLSQNNISLQADTAYTLLFKAYSNSGHDMDVFLHKDASPYTTYANLQSPFNLTTSWTTFRRDFTATGFTGSVTDGRLRFWFAPYVAAGDRYFIDDVVLVKTSTLVAPTFTKQPLPRTVDKGQTATFSVVVSGTTPFTYQWEKNAVAIDGATSASYTTPPTILADDNSQFRCVVTNLVSSVASDPATLTVLGGDFVRENQQPTTFYLAQNHPNPFNPSTIIQFGVPTNAHVTIKVSNLLGQEVRTLVDEVMGAGTHQVTFRADNLPSGIYIYRMQSGSFISTKKLVLIK